MELRVYPIRWLYLCIAFLIQFSSGTTWISFASITFYTNQFYQWQYAALSFNTIFMILSIGVGLFAAWWMDRFGLKSTFQISTWFNFLGNVIRVIGSSSLVSPNQRFYVTLFGQFLAAFAQPFCTYMPTKLSAYWFPENERALSNTIVSMANPIGIAVMYMASPYFVNADNPNGFFFMNSIVLLIAFIPFLLHFVIRKSKPPTPASAARAKTADIPRFWEGFCKAIRIKSFLMLCLCLGGGFGLFNTLYNNLQPALCVQGYNPIFSASMGALVIISGLVGSAISSIYVDRYNADHAKVMKISYGIAGLATVSLSIALGYSNQHIWIVSSIIIFGMGGFAMFPIGLETGAEITYPVAEATCTGLIMIAGQIQGIIWVSVTNYFTGKPSAEELIKQTCVSDLLEIDKVLTWNISFYIWSGLVIMYLIIFAIFFKPIYRRREFENNIRSTETNVLTEVTA